MKKVILTAALILSGVSIAYAQDIPNDEQFLSQQEMQMMEQEMDVQADVAADTMARPRRYVCYARNMRGQYFRAIDWTRTRAQRRAIDFCERHSRVCWRAGCNVM